MLRRLDIDPADRDERLGEAIERYLALAEEGHPPDPDVFVARHPDLGDDLRAALEGLALVRGLVGDEHGPVGHRLEAGRHVAGYRIVGELGRGGMGVVYEAVHVALDRPVALKVLNAHAAPDSTGRRRFLNEARTAAGLHHTHIVPVFDVGQVGGLCYYAMQRIEGCGLDRVVRALRLDRPVGAGSGSGKRSTPTGRSSPRPGPASADGGGSGPAATPRAGAGLEGGPPAPDPFGQVTSTWVAGSEPDLRVSAPGDEEPAAPTFGPPRGSAYYRWVARVGHQAAEALAHAHAAGIIHRDVKPSNLLVDARGMVWVADFGLARRLADPALTQPDSLLGTPRYMSPEQVESQSVDGRTDVYSLGATLYELLTLRPPFEGQTAAELARQIIGREPPPPRRADPRIPRDLETIVLKALARRPADRYASAADLAADLARFLAMEPVRARRISPFGRLWRLARRNPAAAAITATAAAIVVAVATVAHLGVLKALDHVTKARDETKAALHNAEAANEAMKDALRRRHLSEASYVRLSAVPGRRKTGLDLLESAVRLGPDAALKARLRDEAVEFLSLRDAVPRAPIPAGPAQGLAFDAAGDRLWLLSADGAGLDLWDATRRQRIAGVALGSPELEPSRPFGCGRLAPAGSRVAVVRPDHAGLLLYDAATAAPRGELPMPGRDVSALVGSPGGSRLVTVEHDRERRVYRVRLWDPDHPEGPVADLGGDLEEREGPGRGRPLVALSPDAATIATGQAREMEVTLWSGRDGRKLGTIAAGAPATALALGPGGLLAVAGGGAVRLWDAESGASLPGFSPHLGLVLMMRFSPDKTTLAVSSPNGGCVELWDAASSTPVATLPMADRIADLAFSRPAGRILAVAGSGGAVSSWAIVEPIGRSRLPGSSTPTTGLAFAGAGGPLAMASMEAPLRLWWPGSCPTAAPAWGRARPTALAFDDRGRLLTLGADALEWSPVPSSKGPKGGPDAPTRIPLPAPPIPGWEKKLSPPATMARAGDGRSLALVRGPEVWIARTDRPAPPRPVTPPPAASRPPRPRGKSFPEGPSAPPWHQVALSPRGDRLYLVSRSDEFHAWALEGAGLDRARDLAWPVPPGVTALALAPDGRALALGDRSGTVALLEAATGAPLGRLVPPAEDGQEPVSSLAFAPSGALLAVGKREHVRLWRFGPAPEPLVRLPGHRGRVITLAFDARSRLLATAGDDRAVAVWDLDQVRRELDARGLGW